MYFKKKNIIISFVILLLIVALAGFAYVKFAAKAEEKYDFGLYYKGKLVNPKCLCNLITERYNKDNYNIELQEFEDCIKENQTLKVSIDNIKGYTYFNKNIPYIYSIEEDDGNYIQYFYRIISKKINKVEVVYIDLSGYGGKGYFVDMDAIINILGDKIFVQNTRKFSN